MRCVHPIRNMRRIGTRFVLAGALVAGVLIPAVALSASTTTTSTAANCGGQTLYKSNGQKWVCTFDEEFSGASLDRNKWMIQTTNQFGFKSGNECMVNSPYTVSVYGGKLNLTVRKASGPFVCTSPKGSFVTNYAGGSVYTKAFAQRYGRFEVRAKFAQSNGISGVQGALWLFPNSRNAAGTLTGPTEIDIAEAYSVHPDHVIPTVHTFSALVNYYKACEVPNYGSAFHTYAVEWTYKKITFYYDNDECYHIATNTSGAVSPFLVALSQAMGVKPNAPTASTPVPARLQVDYVRVWA